METSPETKLNQLTLFSYKSFGSSQLPDGLSQDLGRLPKETPLKEVAPGCANVGDQGHFKLKEADEARYWEDKLHYLYAISITFTMGVTIALILHIYLRDSVVIKKGMLVSDHEHCTALGQKVLRDQGSSVDAAIAATLCLGVVHPHVSGIGGGGVMLVHDIHKNETKLINFQGTAPKRLNEGMLQNGSELKAGLLVGVPGMLRGLHLAHTLYGSLSWREVVGRVATVAKEGFNVSQSLADAISKVKGKQLLQHFRATFFPDGSALHPGSLLRMPGLARVLEDDPSDFYDGNLSVEVEDEVRANGGVLSREDISNYSIDAGHPVEGLYNDFIVQVPPPPSAGADLVVALKLLERFHHKEKNSTGKQRHHLITEALKAALTVNSGLDDPEYNSSTTALLSGLLRGDDELLQSINSSRASPPEEQSTIYGLQMGMMHGQVVVMGPDDLMVSVASSLSGPFGSGIITRSGIILNSLILDFSWPNKTRGQLPSSQRNRIQPGRRPRLSLVPTIVVPASHACGIYMALGQKVKTEAVVRGIMRNKDTIKAIAVPQML
ncbi:glutathione hydrolase 7-like [Aulostomus maculatus]